MKKIFLMILCLFSILFLCAASENKVALLDDRKLIDLSKAIEFAKPGGEAIEDIQGAVDDGSADNNSDSENKDTVIIISVRNDVITYNGNILGGQDTEKLLRRDNKENVRFCLVDDFAEAHIYKTILRQLESLHSEIGLEYSYE